MSKYKYVWLNLNTGKFSNSWSTNCDISNYKGKSEEEFEEEMVEMAALSKEEGWNLIKYTTLTPKPFEFCNLMKI